MKGKNAQYNGKIKSGDKLERQHYGRKEPGVSMDCKLTVN